MREESTQAGGHFDTTRWTLVQIAAMPSGTRQRQALSDLLMQYQRPLTAHLGRKWRLDADRAADVLQTFIVDKVLEKKLVAAADKSQGKFRSLLLKSLDNFTTNLLRDQLAKKRGGGKVHALPESLDVSDQSAGLLDEFNCEWAQSVVKQVIDRMREECHAEGKQDMWRLFELKVVGPLMHGAVEPSYAELLGQFDFKSPREGTNKVITARRMFKRVFEHVVQQYSMDSESVAEEVQELRRILSKGRAAGTGRPGSC